MPITTEGTVNFIKLIGDTRRKIMPELPRPLPQAWEHMLYARLREREELCYADTLVLFLLDTLYSARGDLYHANLKCQKIGEPINNAMVGGFISSSTMWLFNIAADHVQSMIRLLVAENELLKVIDVYSDPISPIIDVYSKNRIKWSDIAERGIHIDISETKVSRTHRLLRYAEITGAKCLGWLPILEIHTLQPPRY